MYQYTKSIFLSISDTSLCIIGSRFVHLIRNDSNTFLFMAEQYSIVYMYYSFFIHSSVDGHLGCFHVLAIVNSAVIDTGVHKSFSILVSSGYMPWGSISGSYDDFIPSFQRNLHIIFHSGCINLHFCQQCKRIPFFSTLSPAFIVCRLFDNGYCDWYAYFSETLHKNCRGRNTAKLIL